MASDGIACLILIQNEQLKQLDTFLYPGYLNTEDGEYITAFCTRLNRGQAIGESLQKIWKSHSIPISTKIQLLKALVWPVATCGCESWTLRQNEQTHLDAFGMKGLRQILRVSWNAKKQMSGFLTKAGVKRELLDTVKARKLAYCGHTMRKQVSFSGEKDNARNSARCTQARKTTYDLDGHHQDVERTPGGRVGQNDRGQ